MSENKADYELTRDYRTASGPYGWALWLLRQRLA